MARYVRCPGCHLRMETAPQLQADQRELAWRSEHEATGTRFIDWPTPESDSRAFPCRRCGTMIERGALVRGLYDETTSPWILMEVPLLGAALGYLIGWIYGWGITAGVIAGALAVIAGPRVFSDLHHRLIENRKLARLGMPRMGFPWVGAIRFTAGTLVTLGIATVLYRLEGWVVMIAVLLSAMVAWFAWSAITLKRRRARFNEMIGERNSRVVHRQGPRE